MGLCLSSPESNSLSITKPAAVFVISAKGDLQQYQVPMTVSEVLDKETDSASADFFLCNSDSLSYDDYIPSLDPQVPLRAGQIYFVLRKSRLSYRLSASDMAALAVKASLALETTATTTASSSSSSSKNASSNSCWRKKKKKARISPMVLDDIVYDGVDRNRNLQNPLGKKRSADKPVAVGVSRSGSVRKLQKYSASTSSRARLAVRSFRLKLTTIHEGSVLQFFN